MTHISARRGARALLAKTIVRPRQEEVSQDFKVRINVKEQDLEKLTLALSRIAAFPVRVQRALSFAPVPERAFTFMTGLVYAFLVRTDGTDARPPWAKHMPLIYHRSKELVKSDLAEAIASLTSLVEQKINSTQLLAELIVLLLQCGFATETTPRSDLVSIIWVSETLRSSHTLACAKIRTAIDDQFSAKQSPYRGLRLSRPEWGVLNAIITEALVERTGIALTVPDGSPSLSPARIEDFLSDLHMSVVAKEVYSQTSERIFKLISTFNARCIKADSCPNSSLENALTRPWSDDADLRAICNVYTNLGKILQARGANVPAVLMANVLIGAWVGFAKNSSGVSFEAVEKPRHVEIPFFDLNLREQPVIKSYTPIEFESQRKLAATRPDIIMHACTRIQAYWRGARVRRCKNLKIIAHFVLNTKWPDLPSSSCLSKTPAADSNDQVTLTRSSLIRLAATGHSKALEGPLTPVSAATFKTAREGTVNYNQPDLIQADHIACARLFFILVYSVFMRSRMVRYHTVLLSTIKTFTEAFSLMLFRQPQYVAAMSNASAEVATRVAEAKAYNISVAKASPTKRSKPVSLLNKISREIREELLSKQIRLRDVKKTTTMRPRT